MHLTRTETMQPTAPCPALHPDSQAPTAPWEKPLLLPSTRVPHALVPSRPSGLRPSLFSSASDSQQNTLSPVQAASVSCSYLLRTQDSSTLQTLHIAFYKTIQVSRKDTGECSCSYKLKALEIQLSCCHDVQLHEMLLSFPTQTPQEPFS